MKTTSKGQKTFAFLLMILAIPSFMIIPASLADAAPRGYPIAFTGGLGAYPRSAPSYEARVGDTRPEGYLVPPKCWTYGDYVPANVNGYTSNIWIQHATDGTFWPEAWLNTGGNGIPSGVPRCSASNQATPKATPKATPNLFYNRNRAVEWALANASQDPSVGFFGASTCTWFVSNALWSGGFPKDDMWTDQGTHSGRQLPGSVTAWSVVDLKAYLESHYSVTVVLLNSERFRSNAVPEAEIGDLIVYDWGEGKGWSHFTMVTSIAPGQYPEVSEWGASASYVKRGWTYSDNSDKWLQLSHPDVRAALIHIDGGVFVSDF